jgi:hypothetical protein
LTAGARTSGQNSGIGQRNLGEINGLENRKNEARSSSSVPLNLLGGHRWPGASTTKRTARAATVVDTEIGTGTRSLSPGGAASCQSLASAGGHPLFAEGFLLRQGEPS